MSKLSDANQRLLLKINDTMISELGLEVAGLTDVGREREHNEDSLSVESNLLLYAIADGMGGHMLGGVASQTALAVLLAEIEQQSTVIKQSAHQEDYYNIVVDAVEACNEAVLEKNRENGSHLGEGMGTTLVGVYFLKGKHQAIVFNVGDSRLYRLRDGVLDQLTRDHTMYQDWQDTGQTGQAPSRNILTKAIGLLPNPIPDVQLENISEGDVILICSDGLSNLVDRDALHKTLTDGQQISAENLCENLVSMANTNGGQDNISVIVIKVHPSMKKETGEIEKNTVAADVERTVQRPGVPG